VKHPRRKPTTPRSQVRSALRRLWLRSRERQAALKRDQYTCRKCSSKQSRAQGREVYVEVHHLDGISNWEEVIDKIFEQILVSPDRLETLCIPCHKKESPSNELPQS